MNASDSKPARINVNAVPRNHAGCFTTGQAARLCSVTPDTVLKWIKAGRIEAQRTAGGHYRISPQELERLDQ